MIYKKFLFQKHTREKKRMEVNAAGNDTAPVEEDDCLYCLMPKAKYECTGCGFHYCSEKCQLADWEENDHADVCAEMQRAEGTSKIEDDEAQLQVMPPLDPTPPGSGDGGDPEKVGSLATFMFQPPARDISFRKTSWYRDSKKLIEDLMFADMFAWLCIQSYMYSPLINGLLFKASGDFSKIEKNYGDLFATRARLAAATKGVKNPYAPFNVFFRGMFIDAAKTGKYLILSDGSQMRVVSEENLIRGWPQLAGPLKIKNTAAFVRLYTNTLIGLIGRIGPSKAPVPAFRSYTAQNIPNTWTIEPKKLRVGQEITNWGFMSYSLDNRTSSQFIQDGATCCMISTMFPTGTRLFLISTDSSDKEFPTHLTPWFQYELLLPPGCRFRVDKIFPVPTKVESVIPGKPKMSQVVYTTLVGYESIKNARVGSGKKPPGLVVVKGAAARTAPAPSPFSGKGRRARPSPAPARRAKVRTAAPRAARVASEHQPDFSVDTTSQWGPPPPLSPPSSEDW